MNKEVVAGKADPSKHYPWVFLGFFVGACLLMVLVTGCFGLFAWGVGSLQGRSAANATTTHEIYSAHATATEAAQVMDPSAYEFLETFDDNHLEWTTYHSDDQFFKGNVKIENGMYTWEISQVRQGFTSSGGIHTTPLYLNDFNVIVDGIARLDTPGDYCYGLRFRSKWVVDSWAFYSFLVCNDGNYSILFYDGSDATWLSLITRQPTGAIQIGDWNTLGVMARGSHFTFLINDQVVHEMDDDHVDAGLIELMVDIHAGGSGSISFDNFAVRRK